MEASRKGPHASIHGVMQGKVHSPSGLLDCEIAVKFEITEVARSTCIGLPMSECAFEDLMLVLDWFSD